MSVFYRVKVQQIKFRKIIPQVAGKKGKKETLKFTINCAKPVDDGIMDTAAFVSNFIYLFDIG